MAAGQGQGNAVLDLSFTAGEDLSEKQYYFVTQSAVDTVGLGGANEIVIGILQNKPESGQTARVRMLGTSPLVADEAIAINKKITCTSTGKGEVADAAGEWVGAVAMEAADLDGDEIQVRLTAFEAEASDA